jgi:hydroxyacylglutathione hydrolase
MMLVKRLYDAKLAQASYLIGSNATGAAIVVDPNRDVEQYLRAASAEGLTITHVAETHIHADFVSGSRELAARAGATLYLSNAGGPEWSYAFAADAGAVLLTDGDRFDVGGVRVDVLHTPGHTPEHLTFLVTDTAVAPEPVAAVTGDFVFVGDVGRPDLLERAAGVSGTMEASARALFGSLQRLQRYPDYLQIWPGHGAGSACGKGIGSLPQTTLGYERRFNWAFNVDDQDSFVRRVLSGQPEPPRYFREMKRVNREGPRMLGHWPTLQRLSIERLQAALDGGAPVVDTRPAAEFAAAHIPGTSNIPLNRSFTTWAGSLLPYDRESYLIIEDSCSHCLDEAVRDLAMIGLDRIAGHAGTEMLNQWTASGRDVGRIPQIDAAGAARQLDAGAAVAIDVRTRAEWAAAHIPGAVHVPLGELADRLPALSTGKPAIVYCQGGTRSAIASSLLRAHTARGVINLTGGFNEWRAAGEPVASGAAAGTPPAR